MENVNTVCEGLRYFDKKNRLGILGGTFNPPHLGHLYMAEQAWSEFGLSRVVLLPVGDPPHKRDMDVLQKDIRLAMVELLAAERPFLEVCTMEMEREGYTYTVDTLTALKAKLFHTDLFYLIGTDTLFELVTWRDFRRVFTMTEFICIMRPGDSAEAVTQEIRRLEEQYGAVIHLSRGFAPDISSTEIRSRRVQGRSVKKMVPKSVEEFMEKNNVFR